MTYYNSLLIIGGYGMATSIQISKELQKELLKRKLFDNETYEEILWALIENSLELNAQTKKELAQARCEVKSRKTHTLSQEKKSCNYRSK
jgi:hypothetical protein